MTDEQIIIGLKDKDPSAFDAVFAKYYTQLYLFTNSLIKNPTESKDIVSDTFLKLWENKYRFTQIAHIEGFFFTTIKNSVIDRSRKNKKRIEVENVLSKSELFSVNGVERKFLEAEIIQKILEKINELPERTQLVFKLIYLEEKSRTEVAELLNISENTVRNLNASATKALRMAFGNEQLALVYLLLLISAAY